MTRDEFTTTYLRSVSLLAESGDVSPTPLLILAGGCVTSVMLVCHSIGEWVQMTRRAIQKACAGRRRLEGVGIGLDRVTALGQGTNDTGSVFTFAIWWRDGDARPDLRSGIIEYDEGNVRAARWDNAYWNSQMPRDLASSGVWAVLVEYGGEMPIITLVDGTQHEPGR